jgi:arylsulfatase A-like enzyme
MRPPLVSLLAIPIMATALAVPQARAEGGPNVVWIVVDDMSADFGCYGSTAVPTPHVDRLAREGARFANAFVTAPVCSPCRSAMITGMYQTAIGAHHHRSGRGAEKIRLPDGVRPVPAIFHDAGWYTCIGDGLPADQAGAKGRRHGLGKTDYNFEWDASIYDGEDWAARKPGQPFFMQVQLPGGKLRDGPGGVERVRNHASREFGAFTDPGAVALPPYLPRDPALLEDRAAYLDAVRLTDDHVGRVLDRLDAEGLAGDTLVIFMTDHGISHVRSKQFLYDEGTHVPFIARGPGVPRGAVRDDLVEHIDMPAISLAAAGLPVPKVMQGRNVLAADYSPREAVFAARDRCDETVDRIRSVRTADWLYIRNFYPDRPALQPNAYKDGKPTLRALRALDDAGHLEPRTKQLLFAPTRPPEELYRWRSDRWQLENLAGEPVHADTLASLRARLEAWMHATRDPHAEPEAMYDSDMKVYLGKGNPAVEANIATMKRWAAEGK